MQKGIDLVGFVDNSLDVIVPSELVVNGNPS